MTVIRKGIAKLGIFTMIAATTVCLVLVGIVVRLGDTLPNIMLCPFLPSYVGETPAAVEVQYATEEEEFDAAKEQRTFVENLAGNRAAFAAPREVGTLRVAAAKNSVKRTE